MVTVVLKLQIPKVQTGLVSSALSFGDHHNKVHVNTMSIATMVTGRMTRQNAVRLDL
jgi:hypothetical protein